MTRPYFAVYKDEKAGYSGGFEQLLRQEKTLYVVSVDRTDAPVVCFENVFPDWAYGYVKEGGIAVVSGAGKHTFSFDAGFLCRAAVEWIDLSFCDMGMARICSSISVFSGEGKGELTLHESRSIKNGLRPGFYPVFLYKEYGKGMIMYTGVPMAEILTYEGSVLRKTCELLDFDERISSVDKQKAAYQKQIDNLKAKIDGIISSHGWREGDAGYQRYNELKSKLDGIEIVERDCGRHRAPVAGHRCSYCNLSLQQIYHRLDDIYKKVYSSNNRKQAKASVMSQVNALYNCCTDAKCSKHAAQWKKGGDYKNKIVERYNRINSL